MFCKNCGNQISENTKFCERCGAPVQTENETQVKEVKEQPMKAEPPKKKSRLKAAIISGIAIVLASAGGMLIGKYLLAPSFSAEQDKPLDYDMESAITYNDPEKVDEKIDDLPLMPDEDSIVVYEDELQVKEYRLDVTEEHYAHLKLYYEEESPYVSMVRFEMKVPKEMEGYQNSVDICYELEKELEDRDYPSETIHYQWEEREKGVVVELTMTGMEELDAFLSSVADDYLDLPVENGHVYLAECEEELLDYGFQSVNIKE